MPHPVRITLHSGNHSLMPEAAAQHAGQRLLNLFVGRLRRAIDERFGGEHDAAEAEAALRGLLIDECLLDGMRFLWCAEPFERGDVAARNGFHRRDARPNRLAFDDDRARATLAEPAAEFRPVHGELVAQDIEQRRRLIDIDGLRAAVDPQIDSGHAQKVTRRVACSAAGVCSKALTSYGSATVTLSVGVVLTPIITKDVTQLAELRGQTLAVDGNGELYQFLALIRLRDGTPLKDSKGRITSHLSGLFYRTTRLMSEHALKLVFVFDGAPPILKAREVEKRRAVKKKYEEDHAAAVARGDMAEAYSKATMTSRLTRDMVAEARELLRLMGVPTVQAPSEGEAQAAHMAATSPAIGAAASKDYDSLLFGAPRLVRFLSISGKEFLPSQGTFRPIVPETIVLEQLLQGWGITRELLVDLAMLVGTDFNEGIKGIGPKKALALVQRHGRIENMPAEICDALGDAEMIDAVRRIFLDPDVSDEFDVQQREPDLDGIVRFLCDEREFGRDRVNAAIERTFRERSLW